MMPRQPLAPNLIKLEFTLQRVFSLLKAMVESSEQAEA